MAVDIEDVYKSTWEHYQEAKKNVISKRMVLEHGAEARSEVFPGFSADGRQQPE